MSVQNADINFNSMQKIRDNEGVSGITVISTFAGGGGSSTGYRMAGGKILLINEFVDIAINTYKKNYPECKILSGDIREKSGYDFLEYAKIDKYELDLFDGSPPCSAFSIAGKRDKGWGKEKNYSTGKKQIVDDLFFEYSRILRDIMPKVFVAENVKGLTLGKARGYFSMILNELRESGYYVEAKILNSSHYGVAQNRERLFFIGIRKDIMKDKFINKLHPKPTVNRKKTIEEALCEYKFNRDDRFFIDNNKKRFLLWENTRKGESFEKAHKKLFGKSGYFTHRKLNEKYVSPTLTTVMDLYHYEEPRYPYIDELKLLAGLPIDYINLGSIGEQWERIGRMVTPPVTEAILNNLIEIGVYNV